MKTLNNFFTTRVFALSAFILTFSFAYPQEEFKPRINELPVFSFPVQYTLEWKILEWGPLPAPQAVSNICSTATTQAITPDGSLAGVGTTNVTAGREIGEGGACAPAVPTGAVEQTVWWKFQTSGILNPLVVSITEDPPSGSPCNNSCCPFSTVVWESIAGGCPMTDQCKMISCQSSLNGPNNPPGPSIGRHRHQISVDEQTPNTWYYVQIIYIRGGTTGCGNAAQFHYWVSPDIGMYTDITNPRPTKTCTNPGGSLCNIVNPTTPPPPVDTAQAYCSTFPDNPVKDTTNRVKRECLVVNSNYNTTLKFSINFKANCVGSPIVWMNLKVYPIGSCTPIFCGYGDIITVTGLSCHTNYKFCYQYENGICIDTNHTPFVWAPNTSCGLPIELLHFDAKYTEERNVSLMWSTASETNNKEFVIERGRDGKEFLPIITLPGAGTTTVSMNYQTFDDHPLAGVSYYRLKQIDSNGDFSYSVVRRVFVGKDEFSLYPNPTNSVLEVNTDEAGEFRLVNVLGQVSFTAYLNKGENHVDVSSLTKGVYLGVFLTPEGISQKSKIILE